MVSGERESDKELSHFNVAPISLKREFALVSTIFLAQVIVQSGLAQGILPDNIIGRLFGVGEDQILWFPAAYALTAGILLNITKRLRD